MHNSQIILGCSLAEVRCVGLKGVDLAGDCKYNIAHFILQTSACLLLECANEWQNKNIMHNNLQANSRLYTYTT